VQRPILARPARAYFRVIIVGITAGFRRAEKPRPQRSKQKPGQFARAFDNETKIDQAAGL
jgi:hypothetical protein